jgi:two-component system, OmpR family, KDP operon response regulator KdpE
MTQDSPVATIVVVDDEPHVLEALQVLLEGQGYRVRTARTGPIALDAIAAETPDLVLLDLAMPEMDGVEVSRRLRSWSRVPILVLSAWTDELQKVGALDAGADDYITKPFSAHELLARIRAILRREQGRGANQPTLLVGDLDIDFVHRRVTRSGQEVHLTPSEFAVLRVLVTNADRVLTHNYLLEASLGPAYADANENLRTHIKRLRRKLEQDASRPRLIVTEPGVGYRFRPIANAPTD